MNNSCWSWRSPATAFEHYLTAATRHHGQVPFSITSFHFDCWLFVCHLVKLLLIRAFPSTAEVDCVRCKILTRWQAKWRRFTWIPVQSITKNNAEANEVTTKDVRLPQWYYLPIRKLCKTTLALNPLLSNKPQFVCSHSCLLASPDLTRITVCSSGSSVKPRELEEKPEPFPSKTWTKEWIGFFYRNQWSGKPHTDVNYKCNYNDKVWNSLILEKVMNISRRNL